MEGFIGVHLVKFGGKVNRKANAEFLIGAGQHSEQLRLCYKKLAYGACRKAIAILNDGGSAVEACAQATAILEDSALTNAGYGSNLTWGGNVECDAGVMDGSTLHHGAVGAVSGVKNPVLLAQHICESQKHGLSLGRVPPSFLVGEGAKTYAVKFGLTIVPHKDLISVESWKLYRHYRRKLMRYQEEQLEVTKKHLDTVGTVCIDSQGNVAASCSSGGIALKSAGRVGQAAVYASGVWAQNAVDDDAAVASCTSGCGEYLVRTLLAREAAFSVLNDTRTEITLHDCMKRKFMGLAGENSMTCIIIFVRAVVTVFSIQYGKALEMPIEIAMSESPFLHDVDEKMGGVFILKYNNAQDIGELLWSYSTSTMCVGYMSAADSKPSFRISELGPGKSIGKCIAVEGVNFHCQPCSRKRPASSISIGSDIDEDNYLKTDENGMSM